MKKPISMVMILIALAVVAVRAQHADPLLLTDEEVKEATLAMQAEQARNDAIIQLVNEAMNVPYDTEHALVAFGKIREAGANLKAAQLRRALILEKHVSRRPDCVQCNYDPAIKSLVNKESQK